MLEMRDHPGFADRSRSAEFTPERWKSPRAGESATAKAELGIAPDGEVTEPRATAHGQACAWGGAPNAYGARDSDPPTLLNLAGHCTQHHGQCRTPHTAAESRCCQTETEAASSAAKASSPCRVVQSFNVWLESYLQLDIVVLGVAQRRVNIRAELPGWQLQ